MEKWYKKCTNQRTVFFEADLAILIAKEGMMQNSIQPLQNNGDNEEDDWDSYYCNNVAEYADINAKLNELNSILDILEQKNHNIQTELIELLKSNQEARKEFRESLEK